jgi:hypothetical protein
MNMFILAITLWQFDGIASHVVYTDPMPLEACEVLEAKVNIPLLFSPAPVNAQAVCIAAPPRR